jgi:hypothetical protein
MQGGIIASPFIVLYDSWLLCEAPYSMCNDDARHSVPGCGSNTGTRHIAVYSCQMTF